jgi:hypothetical protein
LNARLSRQENKGAVIVRPVEEVQRLLALIEGRLEGELGAKARGGPRAALGSALAVGLCDAVRAAVHSDEAGVDRACSRITRALRERVPLEHPQEKPLSTAERAAIAAEVLLAAGEGWLRELEDAVLYQLTGEAAGETAEPAFRRIAVLLDVLAGLTPDAGLLERTQRLERAALEAVEVLRAGIGPYSGPFDPLSETDTLILNYVDLALLRAKYGYGRVPGATLSAISKASYGFGDLVRHYLREDLPDWLERETGLDVRQAQLIAAAIASVNETYGIFTTRGEAVKLHRDMVMKVLLCEHDFCKR